jgi:hypothetical protein
MTKGELRTIIREVLKEELAKPLTEAVEGPTYVIKAWERPGKQGKSIDTSKTGEKYADFDDVIKALQTKYDGLGVYEITWVPSGEKLN